MVGKQIDSSIHFSVRLILLNKYVKISTYKYKIYPNKDQKALLKQMMIQQCDLYNTSLEERNSKYTENKTKLSYFTQSKSLKEIEFLGSKNLGRGTLKRIETAYTLFFNNLKRKEKAGLPRFKSYRRFRSLTWAEMNGVRVKGSNILIKDVTPIKIKLHRPLPSNCKLTGCTIKWRGDNSWWITIGVKEEVTTVNTNTNSVGIDLGLTHLVITSDGDFITRVTDLPTYKKLIKRKRRLARLVSRSKKGTKNRTKKIIKLNKIHQKITDTTNTYLHQQSRKLVNNYGRIYLEDLKVNNLKKGFLSKSFHNACVGRFKEYLQYKAEWAGSEVQLVNPKYTTQICSGCGNKQKLSLTQRTYSCNICGVNMNRDLNAAINVLHRGLLNGGSAPLQPQITSDVSSRYICDSI